MCAIVHALFTCSCLIFDAMAEERKKTVIANNSIAEATTDTIAGQNRYSVCFLQWFLVVVSVVLYLNTLWNGYTLDDSTVLKDNSFVHQGINGLPTIFTSSRTAGAGVQTSIDSYRPLSLAMFAVEYQVAGASPFVGHLLNILVFAGCVLMLFRFLDRLFYGKKAMVAFLAALIFAIHPIHTEVVASIKSRDELLCFFLGFWSLNIFMSYMTGGKALKLLVGGVLLLLAYLSKETVIAFICIVPVVFFLYYNESRRRAVMITGGMLAATVAYLLLRAAVLHQAEPDQVIPLAFIDNMLTGATSGDVRVATEFYILGKYLGLMFVPYPLVCNYGYKALSFMEFSDIKVLLSLAVYLALAGYAVFSLMKKKKDLWAFAIVLFLASIFLFSNMAVLIGATMGERFAFFASAGFCLAGGLALTRLAAGLKQARELTFKNLRLSGPMAVLLLTFGGMTVARNAEWKDNLTLFRADLEKSPDDARLHFDVATAIAEEAFANETDTTARQKMDIESIGHLKDAIGIYPEYADAHSELGRIYSRNGMMQQAMEEDMAALRLDPDNAIANNNVGGVYYKLKRYRQAMPYFVKSMQHNSAARVQYMNLARCYKQLQVYDSAVLNFRIALSQEPGDADANREIGIVFFAQKQYDSAVLHLRKAGFGAGDIGAHQALGIAYMNIGQYDSAEVHFKMVLAVKPDYSVAINYLGQTYMSGGKLTQAIEQFKKAIALDAGMADAYASLGNALYLAQQYTDAIAAINNELKLDDKRTGSYPILALCYQKTGNTAAATRYEALARQTNPGFKLQ